MLEKEKRTALEAAKKDYERWIDRRILFLYVSGSSAYVNTSDSVIDIRGVYLDSKESLLGLDKPDENLTVSEYDTHLHPLKNATLYPLKKTVKMLSKCNPDIIEILGLRSEDIIYCDPLFSLILDNAHLFLSKKTIAASTRKFINSEMSRIKAGEETAASAAKKMYDVIRFLGMATDILTKGKVVTYREKERDLLLDIREGKCQYGEGNPDTVFTEAYERMSDGFRCALASTKLPNKPDVKAINELLMDVYRKTYFGEIRVKTPLGELVAASMDDPDYPGIYIDIAEPQTGVTINFVVGEYNPDEENIVAHVWGDAMKEDSTYDISVGKLPEAFEEIRK